MISVLNKITAYLSRSEADVLRKPRGYDAPYCLFNETGHDIDVWKDSGNLKEDPIRIPNGKTASLRFHELDCNEVCFLEFSFVDMAIAI